MNADTFDELWAGHGFDRTEQRDFWDQRAASFDAHSGGADSSENRRLLVDRLAAKANLNAQSQVLDIGCGPGRHSILFASQVARVEGFDISPNMIERAGRNAHEAGQTNVAFHVMDWANTDLRRLGWEKRFDLVLAARTPAVNDLAALKKMIAASQAFCCLISRANTRNSIHDQLQSLLRRDEGKARISNGFYCAFNLLWLMGYYPEVDYYGRAWETDTPLEEAVSMHVRAFERHTPLAPEQKKALADKLESLSRDGLIHEQVESKMSVMFWSVNEIR